MSEENGFRFSRIHAEGWNAARSIPLAQLEELSHARVEALNPYSADAERRSWHSGFEGALQSWQR